MLSSVVVLPQPPLLVPGLATGAAVETADLRAACRAAASRLADVAADWIAVGADPAGRRTVDPSARGSFAGFGVDVPVALDTRAPGGGPVDPDLPLPLLIAGWAAAGTGAAVRVRGELLAPDADPAACAELGSALAAGASGPEPVGLLVVGDGAAMHAARGPGQLDERAAGFDDAVAAALAAVDLDALSALDPALAAELWVAGRAPWQVLAAAVRAASAATPDGGWSGELLYSAAPFGVAYHVAIWTPDAIRTADATADPAAPAARP